jgi:FKBP-type peptidyl-prolyl cis-trans isomerase
MTRRLTAAVVATLVAVAVATADDKKGDKTFEFPDLNAKEWKKLDSGLKVWDVKEGKGDELKAGAKAVVNYTGWLTDGKAFDSSIDPKFKHVEPFPFTVKSGRGGVIKGWADGVVGMKPGGVRRLVIPPELAYGKQGAGDDIPPDATLVFVVEYLEAGK